MLLSILLVFLSSSLFILSFPKPEISWLVWVSFIPLFFAIEGKSKSKAFGLSYFLGLIFWTGVIYWVNFVTVSGCFLLILYLSLYFGVFGLLLSYAPCVMSHVLENRVAQRTTHSAPRVLRNLVFIPCAWVVLEYLRSHLFTGFGWSLLGYSQYKNLLLIQIADITGTYGVSFLIIFVNVAIYQIIKTVSEVRRQRSEVKQKILSSVICFLSSVMLIISTLAYGYWRLSQDISGKRLKTSIIQGNFPALEEKWIESYQDKILNKYINLTYKASQDNPDLVVWPETSIPDYISDNLNMRQMIAETAEMINSPILAGTPWKEGKKYYNSAVLFSKKGEIKRRYDKIHLVPFGEYFPFSGYFPFVFRIFESGNFSQGQNFTIFQLNMNLDSKQRTTHNAQRTTKFNVLICYEDIFPSLVRKFVNKGANFTINITDDSWFGNSGATYQHAQALVFRAIENRISAVRAANTGLSCFISPKGRIYGKVRDKSGKELFISGYSTEEIVISDIETFYQKYGDLFVYLCIFISIIALLYNNYLHFYHLT